MAFFYTISYVGLKDNVLIYNIKYVLLTITYVQYVKLNIQKREYSVVILLCLATP